MDIRVRMHRAPTTLITGNGAITKIGDEAKKLRATKVLIVTDPGVACTGLVEQVEAPLNDVGLEIGLFDKAVPEPPMGSVDEIVKFAEKGGYDLHRRLRRRLGDRRRQDGHRDRRQRRQGRGLRRRRPGAEQGPAHHRRPDDGRHRLRGHRDRHLRQREAQREAGRREPQPHPGRGPRRPRAHLDLPGARDRRLRPRRPHPLHRGLHLGERDDAHRPARLRGHQADLQEHPHRHLRRQQRLGAPQHGDGLTARRHRLRQRRRRRRARPLVSRSAAPSTYRTASPTR